VFGPRQNPYGQYAAVIPLFFSSLIENKNVYINGDGTQTRDFTYVTDVIDALIKVFIKKNISGEILNVGSSKTVSVNKIITLLKGSKISIPKRPGEPEITFADINKIKKLTNWRPKVSIKEGIQFMLKDIDNWRDAPLWTPKKIKKATKKWFLYLNNK
jgi:UDP-glucose 4-epimerase